MKKRRNSKTTFVTVNRIALSGMDTAFIIQKQPLLLLINACMDRRRKGKSIQKQPLLLLINKNNGYKFLRYIIQKQPLLLLIKLAFWILDNLDTFKNNLCYC